MKQNTKYKVKNTSSTDGYECQSEFTLLGCQASEWKSGGRLGACRCVQLVVCEHTIDPSGPAHGTSDRHHTNHRTTWRDNRYTQNPVNRLEKQTVKHVLTL